MTIAWWREHLGRISLGRVEWGLFRRSGLQSVMVCVWGNLEAKAFVRRQPVLGLILVDGALCLKIRHETLRRSRSARLVDHFAGSSV